MKKTEECKAIITVEGKKYETCHLRMGSLNLTDDSFYLDKGIMWFCFKTVDEYSSFYNDVRSSAFDKDKDIEDITTDIEFNFSNTHSLIPRKEGKNGVHLLEDGVTIRDNKIILDISFHGKGRFYFKEEE